RMRRRRARRRPRPRGIDRRPPPLRRPRRPRAAIARSAGSYPYLPQTLDALVDVAARRLVAAVEHAADLAMREVAREPQDDGGALLLRKGADDRPELPVEWLGDPVGARRFGRVADRHRSPART